MSIAILSSAMAARVPRARPDADRALARFAPEIRGVIAATCARDPRFVDLAQSFPALLHRIAVRRDESVRESARLVLRGASLQLAAEATGLPLWTRRLPAEAFGRAAHELPGGASFHRRILNVLPPRRRARGWLDGVARAARWGEEDFVVWSAREIVAAPPFSPFPMLALFAWYSLRPELLGGGLMTERWSSRLKAKEAMRRAEVWRANLELAFTLGERKIDPWFEPATVDGLEIRPVASLGDLIAEAEAMRNCVRTYGEELICDTERLWSIRRAGKRIATLSVRYGEAPFPRIVDLKGPNNRRAPAEAWIAARKWLDAQAGAARPELDCWDAPFDRKVWAELWKPYWLARGRIPSELSLAPNPDAFQALRAPWRRRRRRVR